ncbi:hypothetical protein [Sphingosinithalassobacter sp. CS137]|uniref:hypothetical protein n=1 Tax=Sphingosinithalassobacter sp. CS137 TaxID=2762748 RepID=UPI00165DE604|nr:hypothetical protein [Sphingosinithalassobacter sp. CS137]
MFVPRFVLVLAAAAGLFGAAPASAQFFFKSADLAGPRVTGAEPGMTGPELPQATPEELRAALVWNLRAALNVAALQCQFEPTLLTLNNYNSILTEHKDELKTSYETLERYFNRVSPSRREGQAELDRFGTRVYSGFSTVSAQLTFCQTAASIADQAIFTEEGALGDLAQSRMRELRNSLVPWGEQFAPEQQSAEILMPKMPPFGERRCWRRDVYRERRCGPL